MVKYTEIWPTFEGYKGNQPDAPADTGGTSAWFFKRYNGGGVLDDEFSNLMQLHFEGGKMDGFPLFYQNLWSSSFAGCITDLLAKTLNMSPPERMEACSDLTEKLKQAISAYSLLKDLPLPESCWAGLPVTCTAKMYKELLETIKEHQNEIDDLKCKISGAEWTRNEWEIAYRTARQKLGVVNELCMNNPGLCSKTGSAPAAVAAVEAAATAAAENATAMEEEMVELL